MSVQTEFFPRVKTLKMSKLAEKTREEAQKQEKKSLEIEKLAKESRDNAKKSHVEAKEAIFGGEFTVELGFFTSLCGQLS